jgi:hypothetical protein
MRAAEHHLSLETRPRRSGLAAPELLALGVGELRRCIVRNVRPARPREPVNNQRVTTVASWPPVARHLRTTNGGAGDSWDGERSEGGEVPQSAADADSSQGRSERRGEGAQCRASRWAAITVVRPRRSRMPSTTRSPMPRRRGRERRLLGDRCRQAIGESAEGSSGGRKEKVRARRGAKETIGKNPRPSSSVPSRGVGHRCCGATLCEVPWEWTDRVAESCLQSTVPDDVYAELKRPTEMVGGPGRRRLAMVGQSPLTSRS